MFVVILHRIHFSAESIGTFLGTIRGQDFVRIAC
jgi:hypothetical protein